MKALVIVDMQHDFVDGVLGTAEAQNIVSRVNEVIEEAINGNDAVFYTMDTHEQDYLSRKEGRNLPVPHCIKGTEGWEIACLDLRRNENVVTIEKPVFGSPELAEQLKTLNETHPLEMVTFIGVCTDICVVSNALMVSAFLPETDIQVIANCCAGTSEDAHQKALDTMRSCQVEIV